MVPEGAALDKVLRDDNVQGAAELEQFPISYRGGHRLRSLAKKLPEKSRNIFRLRTPDLRIGS